MVRPHDLPHPFPWKAAAPSLAVSAALLAVTICAASVLYVNHRANAAALERAIEGFDAAVELEASVSRLRQQLTEYILSGDPAKLEELADLEGSTAVQISRLESMVLTPEGRVEIAEIRRSFSALGRSLRDLPAADVQAHRQKIIALIDHLIDREILARIQRQRTLTHDVVDDMRAENRTLLAWSVWLLVVLGIGGTAAGVLSGFRLARLLQRQLVELSVTVRSAAGSLEPVGGNWGPIEVEPSEDLTHVQSMVSLLAERIGLVVQKLQAAERESMHQDQLAALGQLAAGLAHELRNPLTSIKTLVEAARSSGGENPLDDRDLGVIEEEIARLDETLQAFLDYARPPKLTRRRVDLRDVIDRTVQLVGPRAERQFVNVLADLPAHPVEAILDPEQLRQVLLNLLLNAVDALGGGGRVTISLVTEAPSGLIRLTVEDDGPGIREDLLGRLFEPFVSTKPSGTGLGLTVCRRIIDSHGGALTAENRPEGGARFTILLPRQTEPAPPLAESSYAYAADH